MDVMTNMLREHIPDGSRIHYVITNGGKAPNVVPDEAEVYYVVRHVEMSIVKDIWGRVVNAAKGAAIGTGTTYDLAARRLGLLAPAERDAGEGAAARAREGRWVHLHAEERAFAERLQKSDAFTAVPLETAAKVRPLHRPAGPRPRTSGDVSWVVPTVQLSAATWVPGRPRTRGRRWRPAARPSATRA